MPLGFSATEQLTEQFTRMGVDRRSGSERQIPRLVHSTRAALRCHRRRARRARPGDDRARPGHRQLQPRPASRFEAIGDSLTTVSAKSGASATNILAFSRNIAPMAQAAGIGTTGILGISSAFARLGEDGIGASTAINKMLSDMNRAVRDGGPEMKLLRDLAGMSADEFERLFKSNPAEALTQVTQSIANAGTAGPAHARADRHRGHPRACAPCRPWSASGGLRPAIAEATNAYGSDSTSKAARRPSAGSTTPSPSSARPPSSSPRPSAALCSAP